MRIALVVLGLALLALQYRLWLADDGFRATWSLERSVAAQQLENEALAERNEQLAAEVRDLKQGLEADSGSVGIEIEVTPNISIESDIGQTGESNVGIKFKWDY